MTSIGMRLMKFGTAGPTTFDMKRRLIKPSFQRIIYYNHNMQYLVKEKNQYIVFSFPIIPNPQNFISKPIDHILKRWRSWIARVSTEMSWFFQVLEKRLGLGGLTKAKNDTFRGIIRHRRVC